MYRFFILEVLEFSDKPETQVIRAVVTTQLTVSQQHAHVFFSRKPEHELHKTQ